MKILMLNQDWFAAEWRAAGHEVVTSGSAVHLDHIVEKPLGRINDIVRDCGLSGVPDLIVYHDNSMPISVVGLEETEIPTLFYSVDAHHHSHWHKHLGVVCDKSFVAHRDYLTEFQSEGVDAEWLPLWASRLMEPSDEKKYDAIFVGTMDPDLNKDRVQFFDELCRVAPVTLLRGEFWKFYPHARIVINQTVKGDLNFRVFEALASGSLVLTERSSNGLFELFEDGRHLVTYERGNVSEAAQKIKELLAQPEKCKSIGLAGFEEILKHHTVEKRAETVFAALSKLKKLTRPTKFFSSMVTYLYSGIRYEKVSMPHAALCFTRALQSIEQALLRAEKIHEHLVLYAVLACSEYDRFSRSMNGYHMLCRLQEAYPNETILRLAVARGALNAGKRELAVEVIKPLALATDEAFSLAETVVRQILDMRRPKREQAKAY